jgi:hypothetical protein
MSGFLKIEKSKIVEKITDIRVIVIVIPIDFAPLGR